MKSLRNLTLLSALCVLSAQLATAEPRGGSNQGRDYMIGDSDNSGWAFGAFFQSRERQVSVDDVEGDLDESRAAVYIGHPITSWISLYAIAGGYDGTFSHFDDENDQSFLYGGSANFDLFTHEIQDPLLMENQIRVNANLTYYVSEAEILGDDRMLNDFVASLTVSIVNDIMRSSDILWPEALAIFGGPVYAASQSNDVDDEESEVGATAGFEIYHTKRISYFVRADVFENTGYAAGLNVRL